MSIKFPLITFSLPLLLFSCSSPASSTSSEMVRVVIEEGEHFTASPSYMDIPKGEDALFKIIPKEGYEIEDISYPDYSLIPSKDIYLLTLEDVDYSTVVTISLDEEEEAEEWSSTFVTSSEESSSKEKEEDPYIDLNTSSPQIRINAPSARERFEKEGYLQTGWSENKDASSEYIGFGWRVEKTVHRLYPIFEKETDIGLFKFVEVNGGYHIKGYSGNDSKVVLPSSYKDGPVTGIDGGALISENIESLILPPSIVSVAKGAISCPNLSTLTFFDSTTSVSDLSFTCPKLKTIRLNAILKPRFSGTYWDTFQNKIDYLRQNESEKKLILFSGSSTRYGFDSPTIEASFPEYKVVNMGVYAYSGAYPQLEIILGYLKENDVLFHSPELDAIIDQFCYVRGFDARTWNFLESGYQELARLDMRRFTKVFDTFKVYQSTRSVMEEKSYSTWAYLYDDDGNKYEFPIYNVNGDLTLYRKNTEGYVGPIGQQIIDYRVDSLFGDYPNVVKEMDDLYQEYIEEKGIKIYFGHAPKNRYCLEETGTEEDRVKIDEYLKQNLNVPIIMDIESSLYDTKYFYLIDNHLSSDGVIIHTDKIISFFKDAGI